jgi:hypothetical protein
MTTIIPAIYLIGDQKKGEDNLIALYDGIQFIPGFKQVIPMQEEVKLSTYNRKSLDEDLNDKNLEQEIENLEKTKNKTIDLNNLQSQCQKFSASSFSYNRFQSKNLQIPGVGVDGAGFDPLIYPQEISAINLIEEVASASAKWNPDRADGDEILRESVKNTCFWQAFDLTQFPIGTPVQVCSAVIQLLSPIKNPMTTSTHVEFVNVMTGKEFIKRRPEIEGLRYFIDGNAFDIENKDILIHGVSDFDNQKFMRFGWNGEFDEKGVKLAKISEIHLLTENATGVINTQKYQLDHGGLPEDYKLINTGLRTNYLKEVIRESPNDNNEKRRGVLLFLFTIFFEYACYIYNFYEEKLISKLNKKTSTELVNQLRIANKKMIGNFILLINYSIIRKFEIKDQTGQYFNAQNFISVEEVAASNTVVPKTDKKSLTNVVNRIHSDKIKRSVKGDKDVIRVFFENDAMYNDTNGFTLDENQFKPDNFPIVFDTNKLIEPIAVGSSDETFLDVSYLQSIKRLTDFLLQGNNGEVPKFTLGSNKEERIIAVGAPMQNDDVFQQTFEALESYYTYIKSSKQVYLQYAQLKIDIFRSGFPSDTIIKWFNDFLTKFNIIFNSIRVPQKQNIELLKLIGTIMNEYKKYRKQELKYLGDKTVYENNKKRVIGNRMFDRSREIYRGILSVRAGLSAEMLMTIANYSYNIFVRRTYPAVTSNFIADLNQQRAIFDGEIQIETQKILQRQILEVNRKFGKGSMQSGQIQPFSGLIGPGNIPQPPPQFLQMFSGMMQPGSMSSFTGSPGSPGMAGRINISLENRLKVENLKFWQDLRTIFNGRTLFLPVVKLNSRNNFDDSEFYLINILSSMIFNKLSAIQISNNGIVSRQAIDSKLLNNGYILLSANTADLSNPNSWRCVNYKNIARLKKSGGVFKDIKKIRGLFFNIIANNLTLTEILNVAIPPGSNTSTGLVKYCSNVLKKDLPNCNILISRQQFAKTVQPKMASLSGTIGIDLMSGVAYFEQGPYAQSRNSDIVVR